MQEYRLRLARAGAFRVPEARNSGNTLATEEVSIVQSWLWLLLVAVAILVAVLVVVIAGSGGGQGATQVSTARDDAPPDEPDGGRARTRQPTGRGR